MVKIDGPKVRGLREAKGLTQLYLATAVGVTTETISRWEHRRYPAIKSDNAEKLAAALEVELSEILDAGEQAVPLAVTAPATRLPSKAGGRSRRPGPKLLLGLLVGSLLIIAGWYVWSSAAMEIKAVRILPAHTAPGQTFPVIVRLLSDGNTNIPFIVRESVREPAVVASPQRPATVSAVDGGSQLKWISKLASQVEELAYILTSSGMEVGGTIHLHGTFTVRKFGGSAQLIGGRETIRLAPFHWADSNRDHRIDDQEILAVYEDYAALAGLDDLGLSLIEEIWFGSSYRWDQEKNIFVIIP